MNHSAQHPHISEFDRIDDLPTLAEVVVELRACCLRLLGAVSLTWR